MPPGTTMCLIAGMTHMIGSLWHSRRMREAQHQLDDFYASLENNQELGGNDNARTR